MFDIECYIVWLKGMFLKALLDGKGKIVLRDLHNFQLCLFRDREDSLPSRVKGYFISWTDVPEADQENAIVRPSSDHVLWGQRQYILHTLDCLVSSHKLLCTECSLHAEGHFATLKLFSHEDELKDELEELFAKLEQVLAITLNLVPATV